MGRGPQGPSVSARWSPRGFITRPPVTYLGSRFWTFRHRINQALLREGALFVVLNVVGLAIAECVIAIVTYGLDMKGTLAYNAASVAGTGLGTIFRYFSYKKWVFLAGAPGAAVAAGEAAVSGIVDAADTSEEAALRAGAIDGHQAPHHNGQRYEPSGERSEPPRQRAYGPPWELLDPADAPPRPASRGRRLRGAANRLGACLERVPGQEDREGGRLRLDQHHAAAVRRRHRPRQR